MKLDNVVSFGVELEGGWRDRDGCGPLRGMKSDGSVSGLDTAYVGEIASPVFRRPAGPPDPDLVHLDDWTAQTTRGGLLVTDHWGDWIEDTYPDAVNETCGFHIHVGLSEATHAALTCATAYERWRGMAVAWSRRFLKGHAQRRALSRLAGENTYCRLGLRPDVRYQQWNLMSEHETLEIRSWPMPASAGTANKVVRFTLRSLDRLASEMAREGRLALSMRLRADGTAPRGR